jgi:hypothetical protein
LKDDDVRDEHERKLRNELDLLSTAGGRRLVICRRVGDLTDAIRAIPANEADRNELCNLANVLLRLAVLLNDGGPVSPHKVPAF